MTLSPLVVINSKTVSCPTYFFSNERRRLSDKEERPTGNQAIFLMCGQCSQTGGTALLDEHFVY